MQTVNEQQNSRPFVDRRAQVAQREGVPERRQFTSSVTNANPAIAELSAAVDQYKLAHHRRFITFEELYNVISELGYHK
jgi:hypothetical protein